LCSASDSYFLPRGHFPLSLSFSGPTILKKEEMGAMRMKKENENACGRLLRHYIIYYYTSPQENSTSRE